MTTQRIDIEDVLDRFCVIEVHGLVGRQLGDATDPEGLFVAEYDPDGMNGCGSVKLTANLSEAKRYTDGSAAVREYMRQSTIRPLREDGEPNRPLMAYTVAIVDKLAGDLKFDD